MTQSAVQPKTSAMPADDRLGLDDNEDTGLTAPEAVEGGPEKPVQGVQGRPRPFAFEHGHLLSQGEDFQGGIASTAEEAADHGEDGEDELRHELTFVTWRNRAQGSQRS